ncbi:LysE family translocator [Actinocatenispora sera]|uniref:LysE family translocator n=1 Tax=Actinocatenispora sera TaxID=390989 RepID=UPI0033C14963
MISPDRLLAFALTAALIIAIPGPGVLFVVGRALSSGRRAGLASALGQEAGGFVLVIAVALGIGSLMERSVLLFTVVKLIGAAYLIVLGIQAIARRHAHVSPRTTPDPRGTRAMRDGFLVGVTNPKGAVFFAAVLPQFTDRAHGHLSLQILLLGAVFVLIALVADAAWSLLAAGARTWFAGSPRRLARINGAGGCAMIAVGATVACTARQNGT